MQGSIFKRVRHECIKGTPRWVRLPNPTPRAFPCPVYGANLTKEKKTRYDCFWRTNGKLCSKTVDTKHAATRFLTTVVAETHNGTYQQTRPITMNAVFDEWEKHLDVKLQQGRLNPARRKRTRAYSANTYDPALVHVAQIGCRNRWFWSGSDGMPPCSQRAP